MSLILISHFVFDRDKERENNFYIPVLVNWNDVWHSSIQTGCPYLVSL